MTASSSSSYRSPLVAAMVSRLGRVGQFIWAGWIGLAALSLITAVWQAGHEAFGAFILPDPATVLSAVAVIILAPENHPIIGATAERAMRGLGLSLLGGGALGLACGYSAAAMRLTRPLLTVLLGVPPIAWIVLVMIWFGSTDTTVIVTVVAAVAPVLFLGAAEGTSHRDRRLDDMARAFGVGPARRAFGLGLRQALTTFLPALAVASGTAFKVAVMSELLTNAGGAGGALADARATLDASSALAWIVIVVGLLLAVEYLVIHPFRSELERWRTAANPFGVKT